MSTTIQYQISNDLQINTRPEGHSDPLPIPQTSSFAKRPVSATKGLAARPLLSAILEDRIRSREAERLQALREAEELERHQRGGSAYCVQLSPRLRLLAYPLFADRLSDPLSSKACKAFARGFMLSLGEPRKLEGRNEK